MNTNILLSFRNSQAQGTDALPLATGCLASDAVELVRRSCSAAFGRADALFPGTVGSHGLVQPCQCKFCERLLKQPVAGSWVCSGTPVMLFNLYQSSFCACKISNFQCPRLEKTVLSFSKDRRAHPAAMKGVLLRQRSNGGPVDCNQVCNWMSGHAAAY